jgi:hypothetical protein
MQMYLNRGSAGCTDLLLLPLTRDLSERKSVLCCGTNRGRLAYSFSPEVTSMSPELLPRESHEYLRDVCLE